MPETPLHIAADDRPPAPRPSGARWGIAAVGALLIVIGAIAYYFWQRQPAPRPVAAPPAAPQAQAPAPPATAPAVEHPVETTAPSAPLPSLAESDPAVRDELASLFGRSTFDALFRPQELIRNIVATVDNLPRKNVALRLVPLKPVPGAFEVRGSDGGWVVGPDNAARYAPYVRAFEAVDARRLVALYVRLYPLFQQAYADLGYPSRYFNDRLFEVIDHLLAAPEAPASIALVQPKVLYDFADPPLADLSAGQKIMVRMGSENEAKVKAKLRELKRALSKGV
ncbi:MAG TPA: DUF3014 domain-containing protein [Casimicrobiaceae bacterium]|nr:DUF3014 domain-containing protein [Casimicrobiaceae bacterium]